MAETLGQQYDRLQEAIKKLESRAVQSYEIDGLQATYVDLPVLYKRADILEAKIERYGRDYIPGQNTKPQKRVARVVFD